MERRVYYGVLVVSVLVAALLAFYVIGLHQKNYLVPKNLGAVDYTNGDSAIVRFNLHDPQQVTMVRQIESYCASAGFTNCMNAKQRFGFN